MAFIVITGAARGIGLELAKLYHERGDSVLATCRQSSPALQALGAEVYADLELSSEASLGAFEKYLGERGIDSLILNAGILHADTLEGLDMEKVKAQIEINALAPLRLSQLLAPRLKSGSKLALITSRMGSLADNGSGAYYGYRMSKAALNMAGINLARDLGKRGISVFILHPGMVATEMTGRQGIPPEQAAAMLVERIDALGMKDSGKFWHANGEELPW